MPVTSKIFSYTVDGLSYTVTVYEENGQFLADIELLDGAMDVNAIYFGDDDFSGDSVSLDKSLNMNGAKLDGESIQWDDAAQLSDTGIGPEGTDKETYLTEPGDTLTVELDIDSLDDVDVFGIRATSTSTQEGSIKAVSTDPEEPEDPEDPEEPLFDKVFFGTEMDENGGILDGIVLGSEPSEFADVVLPEDQEPTFANYLAYYDNEVDGYDVPSLESIIFYETQSQDYPVEIFRIDAPEGGFQDADEVLAAYDAAVEAGALDLADGQELMATLALPDDLETDTFVEEEVEIEDDVELV